MAASSGIVLFQKMALQSLPDDLLLVLFRYLDTRQLLLARGVCRRWRDTALHPHAWKHRSLEVAKAQDVPFLTAALTSAPCLYSLRFRTGSLLCMEQAVDAFRPSKWKLAWRRLALLSRSTVCAVRSLDLYFDGDSRSAATILMHQVALHSTRLRRLTLRFCPGEYKMAVVLDFLRALQAAGSRVAEMAVYSSPSSFQWDVDALFPNASASGGGSRAYLKRLEYFAERRANDSVLELFLSLHGPTLEVVEVSPGAQLTSAAFSLLARCPNLEELKCPLTCDVAELARCRSVTKLSLHWQLWCLRQTDLQFGAVLDFFSRATRLRHLTFVVPHSSCAGEELLLLVLALGSTGKSTLATLVLETESWHSEDLWGRLGAALWGLPLLETLWLRDDTLFVPPVCFLRAATAPAAPRLRRIHMQVYIPCAGKGIKCGEGWLPAAEYVAELRDALRRSSRLHVSGLWLLRHPCTQAGGCWRGPQGLPDAPLGRRFGLYGHAQRDSCDLHGDRETWVQVLSQCSGVAVLQGQLDTCSLGR